MLVLKLIKCEYFSLMWLVNVFACIEVIVVVRIHLVFQTDQIAYIVQYCHLVT